MKHYKKKPIRLLILLCLGVSLANAMDGNISLYALFTDTCLQYSGKYVPAGDFCKDLKKIIRESGNGFKDVRLNKKEDEDSEGAYTYETHLPKMGFESIKIFEESAMSNDKGIKTIYSCRLDLDIENSVTAEKKYTETVDAVKNCLGKSGELKKSDGLQHCDIAFEENGLMKEVTISLTKYASSSSLTIEVFFYSKN
ncbi:MAG: hypothetical protein U0X40_01710 [Ferruginibacter sp.]